MLADLLASFIGMDGARLSGEWGKGTGGNQVAFLHFIPDFLMKLYLHCLCERGGREGERECWKRLGKGAGS